jgi:hypothetical protein
MPDCRDCAEDDMSKLPLFAVTVGLIIARTTVGVQAGVAAERHAVVKVRLYNYGQVPTSVLQAASFEAARIFERAGLASTWEICRIRDSVNVPDDPACAGPAGSNDFAVRVLSDITQRRPDRPVPDVLGFAVISPEHVGILATVLFQRVCDLAERSRIATTSLLARVMAHEVGHLVIGSNEHARTGIMRAVWKLDPDGPSEPTEWKFSQEEVARMRRRVPGVWGN